MKVDLRPLNIEPCPKCKWRYGTLDHMTDALHCSNGEAPPHRQAINPNTPDNWRYMHDYSGDGFRQKCQKCKQVLHKTDIIWVDDKPICPVVTPIGSLESILGKYWCVFVDRAYRDVYFFPFSTKHVYLKDELNDLELRK